MSARPELWLAVRSQKPQRTLVDELERRDAVGELRLHLPGRARVRPCGSRPPAGAMADGSVPIGAMPFLHREEVRTVSVL